ncbi:MAG: glycosyltransferase family 4 protein [Bacteroidota bacterium]|nr:glycosyltransferase family 4 protein [Bacteroidota bacterium]
MKRIKIFLGGYITYTNAQNLNCRAIAQHLNKSRFDVYALQTHFGKNENFDINTFNCFMPFYVSKHFGFLWGILSCDVAYLPKHIDTPFWVLKLSNLLKKPIFTTIEGNVVDRGKANLIDLFGNEFLVQKYFKYFDKIFAITKHLSKQSNQLVTIDNNPLFLGVNYDSFTLNKIKTELKQIVFVGGIIKRKRVEEVVELAKHFSALSFVIVGEGVQREQLENTSPENVEFLGKLPHKEIREVFKKSDLHFLPSRSEGFPKVILEAASAGIPSMVYKDYGASDWMRDKYNGFIISDFDQAISLVKELVKKPELLEKTSKNAKTLAKSYDWKVLIKDWEKVIVELVDEKL